MKWFIGVTLLLLLFLGLPRSSKMIYIPGGSFWMGCADPQSPEKPHTSMEDCRPLHRVRLDGFWIDQNLVTRKQFARFANLTGYHSVAERIDGNSEPGAIVFSPPTRPASLNHPESWWRFEPGAHWLQSNPSPQTGAGTNPSSHNLPVVFMAWSDAAAYCRWAGKRLPTEAEFEYAARGGLDRKLYSWGDEFKPNGRWMANTFQGHFPEQDSGEDGFIAISPVASYPPNGYGLYDITGNVWEWTQDWYRPDYYATLSQDLEATHNPKGPSNSFDPMEPGVPKRVQRGGSFLCSENYCRRYLVGARGRADPDSPASHTGFRCASDAF